MKTATITLPEEAPIMVLPGAVLFANAVLPLRIFEPRYRAMLDWALEHERMFCVAMLKPGITASQREEDYFQTAGIGLVAASVTQADGTSNLMLHGLGRVRFTGLSQRAPFRIATITPVPDLAAASSQAAPLMKTLRRSCRAIRVDGARLPEPFTDALDRIKDPGLLADTIAHSLVNDGDLRQSLLEEESPIVRLATIAQILARNFPQDGGA